MFNLLLSGLAAFQQVIFFVIAALFAVISTAILGNALYWFLHATRVQGEIVGVREHGGSFYTVYRYILPSGTSHEATSPEESTNLRGRDTGLVVPLLVCPERPAEAVAARSHVWTLVGAVMLGFSLWMIHFAVTAFPIGPMTWIAGGALAANAVVKFVRTTLPKEKCLGASTWRGPFAQRRPPDDSQPPLPLQRAEDLLAQPERRAQLLQERVRARRYVPLLLGVGVLLLGMSFYLGRSLTVLEAAGSRTGGVVQSLQQGTGRNASWYPVVSFTSSGGTNVRFQDNFGSSPPSYRVGQRVQVLYLANDLGRATIDRGIWNWLPTLSVLIFGALLCVVGGRALRTPVQS